MSKNHKVRPDNLTALINEKNFLKAHNKQKPQKAAGIDGITREIYDQNAVENIIILADKIKDRNYVPQPVRFITCKKKNGGKRKIGIPAYEDRLVQSVMADNLNYIYKAVFYDCSFSNRRGVNYNDALNYLESIVTTKNINYIFKTDIKDYNESINHKQLCEFLNIIIRDSSFLEYINKFLKTISGESDVYDENGLPQGSKLSGVLENIYMHYVFDDWLENDLKKQCDGEIYFVRYVDDILVLFQYKRDIDKAVKLIENRFNNYNLNINNNKTEVIHVGNRKSYKTGFSFLGTYFIDYKADGKHHFERKVI